MARIRTLKPEILEDAETAGLSDTAFRLFTAAIVLADDHGNLRAEIGWLRGQVWWRHENPPRVAEFLRELRRANLIVLYEVRGQKYMHLRGWQKHQRIDNAGKPRVPTLKDPEAVPIPSDAESACEVSRNFAEKRGEIPLDHDHDHDHERDHEGEPSARTGNAPRKRVAAPKAPRKAAESSLPVDWQPNPNAGLKAADLNLSLTGEAEKFRLHAEAKGRLQANWDAAFTSWLIRSAEYAQGGSQQRFGSSGRGMSTEQIMGLADELERKGM